MKKPDQLQTIPSHIEDLLDSIHGQLKCMECGQILDCDGEYGIELNPNVSQSLRYAATNHICPSFKFSYDFASPLTIAEQYAQARSHHP